MRGFFIASLIAPNFNDDFWTQTRLPENRISTQ